MDLHGAEGTLHHVIDWERCQAVRGARVGGSSLEDLPVPDDLWAGAPREPVKATYHHVFRTQGLMVGEFVKAALSGIRIRPDFRDGARAQQLVEAGLRSDAEGRRVGVREIDAFGASSAVEANEDHRRQRDEESSRAIPPKEEDGPSE